MFRIISLWLMLIAVFQLPLLGQTDSTSSMSKRDIRKSRPQYFALKVGGGISHFIDFGTSPLNYLGSHSYLGIGHVRMDQKREFGIHLVNTIGLYSSYQSNMLSTSTGISYQLNYYRLYAIPNWSNEKQNIKIGGNAVFFGDSRINNSLMNHAVGFEGFFNLMASFQYARNISRPAYSEKKLLFLTWKKKKMNRFLKARMDIGLINFDLRNGYNYIGQGPIVNEFRILDDYRFSTFSGFRIGTHISYNVYRKNGNLLQFTYSWDALKSGGQYNIFQMAIHSFSINLMIHKNPKERRDFDESIF